MERLKIYCLTYVEDDSLNSIFHHNKDHLQSLKESWSSIGESTHEDTIYEVYPKTKKDLVALLNSVMQKGYYEC